MLYGPKQAGGREAFRAAHRATILHAVVIQQLQGADPVLFRALLHHLPDVGRVIVVNLQGNIVLFFCELPNKITDAQALISGQPLISVVHVIVNPNVEAFHAVELRKAVDR